MSDRKAAVKEALSLLDQSNEEHWTKDNSPRVEAVGGLAVPVLLDLTRAEIIEVAPMFTRVDPRIPGAPVQEAPVDPSTEPTDPVAKAPAEAEAFVREKEQEPPTDPVFAAPASPKAQEEEAVGDAEDERRVLEASVRSLDAQIDQIDAEADVLRKVKDKLMLRRDEMVTSLSRGTSHKDNQRSIMAFIAQQNANRTERARRQEHILQGLDTRAMQAKAPIDQAMARKNTRGAARPAHPAAKV